MIMPAPDPQGTLRAGALAGPTRMAGPPLIRGAAEPQASLADFIWFRTGGAAEWLVRPADSADLAALLAALDPATPVLVVGTGSNLIVRDGGVPGVTIRLPKQFGRVRIEGSRIRAGAAALGISVASAARDAGVAGLEFLRGIPGTIGGAVAGNAGAYGRAMQDVVVAVSVVTRDGRTEALPAQALGFAYRHARLPDGAVIVDALLEGMPGDPRAIGAEMDRIAAEREASQPLRTRTGGSTFKNPPGEKAWVLIDRAGCRGLRLGGAQVSEKHANFLINTGAATALDLEQLGEEVRRRVAAATGVTLEWEVRRVGLAGPAPAGPERRR